MARISYIFGKTTEKWLPHQFACEKLIKLCGKKINKNKIYIWVLRLLVFEALKQELTLFQPYFNVEGRSCACWVSISLALIQNEKIIIHLFYEGGIWMCFGSYENVPHLENKKHPTN